MEKITKEAKKKENGAKSLDLDKKNPIDKIKKYFTEYLLDQMNMTLYDKWFQWRLGTRELLNPLSSYNNLKKELAYKEKFEEEHKNDPIEYDVEMIEVEDKDNIGNIIMITDEVTGESKVSTHQEEKRTPKEGLINNAFLARKNEVKSAIDSIEMDLAKQLQEMKSIQQAKDLLNTVIDNKDYESLVDIDSIINGILETNKETIQKFYK